MLSRRKFGLLATSVAVGAAGCGEPITTVYVVRHAEKQKHNDPEGARDPELTDSGHSRALHLAHMLTDVELSLALASPYRRTQSTVAPSAALHGLSVDVVPAADVASLAQRVRALPKGSSALIAGHSNTVPQIVESLGVAAELVLNEDDYGDLFIVKLCDPPGMAQMRFGD